MANTTKNAPIDHIVWAVPDLTEGINQIKEMTGIAPVYGGRHLQFGTHNALMRLGNRCYFEVIAPDPANREVAPPRWMGVDLISSGQITRWALASDNLMLHANHLQSLNKDLSMITEGRRQTASGELLRWQLTVPQAKPVCEPIPFLIDWQDSIHPSDNLPDSGRLVSFKVTTSDPGELTRLLMLLGNETEVIAGSKTKLELVMDTPKGLVTIC